ncbi:MAG TPA: exodeoxyribonuclease VII large subunit [Rudaea sp.]
MSVPPEPSPEREIYTPSSLTRMARDVLEDTFPLIWVEGEISNCSRPGSGHIYFSLKDSSAQIRCAMFRNRSIYLRFKPGDGQRVLARVRVSLYEARGEFQLIVEHMEPAGEGALLREFERLKAKLAAEGLFDAQLKRPLPKLPRRIGVVTSPTGAAIRDVLSVLARRFPLAEVEILPVPVQGREAPPAIARMLQRASGMRRHDVLLVTRGGGSLEDLWAFNDEAVVRAIRACAIPVVSAVGHEIDVTLADFAADLRAPTPSAAAEILVPDQLAMRRLLERDLQRITRCLRHRVETASQKLDHAIARLRAQHPLARFKRDRERFAALGRRLRMARASRMLAAKNRLTAAGTRLFARNPALPIANARRHAQYLRDRLRAATIRQLETRVRRVGELARALNAVSPLATLQRGYAILVDTEHRRVVKSVLDTAPGRRLAARVADGDIAVRVERKDES